MDKHVQGTNTSSKRSNIRVDPKFWSDSRLYTLQAEIGDFRAIGACVCAWRLAQLYASEGKRLIPLGHWLRVGHAIPLIEAGFADLWKDGVYVRGSSRFKVKNG